MKNTAFIVLALATCSGCAVCYTYTPEFTRADTRPCPLSEIGWCIREIPNVGYIGVNSYMAPDHKTKFNVRLAPRAGVNVRWSSKDMRVVDLERKTSTTLSALALGNVTGTPDAANRSADYLLGYGPTIDGPGFFIPRLASVELQFPTVIADGRELAVPPVRYKEGPRVPVPCPAYVE